MIVKIQTKAVWYDRDSVTREWPPDHSLTITWDGRGIMPAYPDRANGRDPSLWNRQIKMFAVIENPEDKNE